MRTDWWALKGQRYAAVAGILGPVLFTAVWAILGSLQPGYDSASQRISALGAVGAPNALVMNWVGFVPSGLLIAFFGVGLYQSLKGETPSRAGKVGPALVAAIGGFVALAGVFQVNLQDPDSFTHRAHGLVSILAFVLTWIAALFVWWALRKAPGGDGHGHFSLAIAIALFLQSGPLREPLDAIGVGTSQRLLLLTFFAWLVVMAVREVRRSGGRPGGEPAGDA